MTVIVIWRLKQHKPRNGNTKQHPTTTAATLLRQGGCGASGGGFSAAQTRVAWVVLGLPGCKSQNMMVKLGDRAARRTHSKVESVTHIVAHFAIQTVGCARMLNQSPEDILYLLGPSPLVSPCAARFSVPLPLSALSVLAGAFDRR